MHTYENVKVTVKGKVAQGHTIKQKDRQLDGPKNNIEGLV